MIKTSSRWTLIEGFNTWGEGFCSEAEAGRPSRDSSTPLSRNPVLFSSVLGTTIHCVAFLTPPHPPPNPACPNRAWSNWLTLHLAVKRLQPPFFSFLKITDKEDFNQSPKFKYIILCTNAEHNGVHDWGFVYSPKWLRSGLFCPYVTHRIFIRPFPSNQKQATFACHHIKKFW